MKKFALVCALALVLSVGIFSAAAFAADSRSNDVLPADNMIRIDGIIQSIDTASDIDRILVKNSGDGNEIMLQLVDGCKIISNKTQKPVESKDLQVGAKIVAWHSSASTKSLPPITNTYCVLTDIEEDQTVGTFLKVASSKNNADGSIVVLNSNQDLYLTITKDAAITSLYTGKAININAIKTGDQLLAYFDVMLLSMPAQAGTDKVIFLDSSPDTSVPYQISVNTQSGEISCNGQNLQLNKDQKPYLYANKTYIPLRVVAESCGYKVQWQASSKTISLPELNITIQLPLTSLDYQIKNGVTFIAANMFDNISQVEMNF